MQKLTELAEKVGISSSYIDKTGIEHFTTDDIRRFFLKSMGYFFASDEDIERTLERVSEKRPIDEVVSFFANEKIELPIYGEGDFSLEIRNESGKIEQILNVSGGQKVQLNNLDVGYYDLTLRQKDDAYACLLLVAPVLCYQPEFLQRKEHIWGTAVMLYALRSENNMGIGDFSDLADIVRQVAKQGGDVVGINPLGVMSPYTQFVTDQSEKGKTLQDRYNVFHQSDVSPYRTLSRLFVNYAYLDLYKEPDFQNCADVKDYMANPETRKRIAELRESNKVRYTDVLLLKQRLLGLMFAYFKAAGEADRKDEFEFYKKAKGEELDNLATFETLLENNQPIDFWRYWQNCLDDINSVEVKQFKEQYAERIDFYKYCHWLADGQIKKVQNLAKELNMKVGIYGDMPIGAASNGVEVWENPEAYVLEAGVGAPADPMRPRGQSWGFTPYHPQKLKQQHYAPFIKLVRENMQYCGALRIDHAMGLRRLFWGFFTEDNPVVQGAYIYYDIKDLTAILAIESNRKKCLIIGEDLGTVPAGFREYMAEHGLLSYKVFCRQKEKDGTFIKPENYMYTSLAQVSTHDQATAYGFWSNEDIEVFKKCGLYVNDKQYQDNLDGRRKDRENMQKSYQEQNMLEDNDLTELQNSIEKGDTIPERMNVLVNQYGARTNSALFLVRLNDIYKQVVLDNAPGTVKEYPNWRIKMPVTVEEIANSDEFVKMAEMIRNNRPAKEA